MKSGGSKKKLNSVQKMKLQSKDDNENKTISTTTKVSTKVTKRVHDVGAASSKKFKTDEPKLSKSNEEQPQIMVENGETVAGAKKTKNKSSDATDANNSKSLANGKPAKRKTDADKMPNKKKLKTKSSAAVDVDATVAESTSENQIESDKENATSAGQINKVVFKIFQKLRGETLNRVHINKLIQLLKDEPNTATRQATCSYTLKRLIRGTGADDANSSSLHTSYLHGVLNNVPEIDFATIIKQMQIDLPVPSQPKTKEDKLAAVGQILTVRSLIFSYHFQLTTNETLIANIYDILMRMLDGTSYVASLASWTIISSFSGGRLSKDSFKKFLWPMLKPKMSSKNLIRWDICLAVHQTFPKLFTRHDVDQLVGADYNRIFDLYLLGHGATEEQSFEHFGKFISHDVELLKAWHKRIATTDTTAPLKTAQEKGSAIKLMGYILLNCEKTDDIGVTIGEFFAAPTFITMLLAELGNAKQGKGKQSLQGICNAFEASLLVAFERTLDESIKVIIMNNLLNANMQLDAVFQTPRMTQQLLQTLQPAQLTDIYALYMNAVKEGPEKTPQWEHCLIQMQHILQNPKLLPSEKKWRKQQFKELLTIAMFSANNKKVSVRCEDILFTCLLHKCTDLSALRKSLLNLCQIAFDETNDTKTTDGDDCDDDKSKGALKAAWEEVSKSKKAEGLDELFDVLILFLLLAQRIGNNIIKWTLFDDFVACSKNARGSKKRKNSEELEWQDVTTDALLQLLLQPNNYWRQFVGIIWNALAPHLTADNLEQILQMLDMTKNPLGADDDENNLSDEDQDEDDDEDDDDDDDASNASDENDAGGKKGDGEDDDDGDDDEEESRLDQIRENVRLALTNKASESDNEEDNASSVDWNDVGEDEGNRLNAALEAAFQAMRPSSKSAKKPQPTKADRINETTLLHFRIRVLDLVEIYVNQNPQLNNIIDALIAVLHVHKHCLLDGKKQQQQQQQALLEASRKLLRKLITIKSKPIDNDEPVIDCIRELMQPQQQQQPAHNHDVIEWGNKVLVYLVGQSQSSKDIWLLIKGYLDDWVAQRRCHVSMSSFERLFPAAQWKHANNLANEFAAHLNLTGTRKLRRFLLIKTLLANSGRIKPDNQFNVHLKAFVKQVELATTTTTATNDKTNTNSNSNSDNGVKSSELFLLNKLLLAFNLTDEAARIQALWK